MFNNYSIKHDLILRYYEMLADKTRNRFFYDSLMSVAKDKVVVDLGSGTGILAHYALAAGAKFVYAVEKNLEVSLMLNAILKNSFSRDKFKVINDDFWQKSCYDQIDKEIDLAVSETVGPTLFDQGMITTWISVNKHLHKNYISIPDRLSTDLFIFEDANDVEIYNNAPESVLTKDDVIDATYFNSLMHIDTIATKSKGLNSISCRWASIKHKPSCVIENIFSYSNTDLPEVNSKCIPIIETKINVDRPCVVALIQKIEFQSKVLYLTDAKISPWRFSPCFIVGNPGTYVLSFNNKDYIPFPKTAWNLTLFN